MKRNRVKIYAEALAGVISEGKTDGKKIIDNFVKLLVVAGLEKKAKEILNLAEDLLLSKQGKRKIIFEIARKITTEQKKMLRGIAKDGDKIQEKINPELIAGIKIIVDNQRQLDVTMKRKLQEIF